ADKDCREACPVRELKAFSKIMLQPGESHALTFVLKPRDFSHYDISADEWRVDEGPFEIAIGSSSRDIRQRADVVVVD
ncbi:MAG: fibronectin type III-like domain-contianing protein, partial [Steroidobacter sp.]